MPQFDTETFVRCVVSSVLAVAFLAVAMPYSRK